MACVVLRRESLYMFGGSEDSPGTSLDPGPPWWQHHTGKDFLRVSWCCLQGKAVSYLPDELIAKFGAERVQSKHNTLWEGLALLVVRQPRLPQVKALSRGSAKSPALNVLAREFAYDQATRCYQVRGLVHIAGVSNVQADALSRVFSPSRKTVPEELLDTPRAGRALLESEVKMLHRLHLTGEAAMPKAKRSLALPFWPSCPPEPQAKSQRRGVLHEGPGFGRPSENDPQLQGGVGAGNVGGFSSSTSSIAGARQAKL